MLCKKGKIEVFAPEYYSEFKCIANNCRHSCCIDWEIYIDDDTLCKYEKLPDIMHTVSIGEDGAFFNLCKSGRCPHLNEQGLCQIIISHGEDCLSEICKNHPRFFNRVTSNRIEAGLGLVCEEACRLILENDKKFSFVKIEEFMDFAEENPCAFESLEHRDRIVSLTEKDGVGFLEKLALIKNEYSLCDIHTSKEWIDRFLSLEILDPQWAETLKAARNKALDENEGDASFDNYYERLLIYFVYRHVSVAESFDNLRARLAFSILSVQMIRLLFENGSDITPEGLIDVARSYSAEIEYSEDNTFELLFELERTL